MCSVVVFKVRIEHEHEHRTLVGRSHTADMYTTRRLRGSHLPGTTAHLQTPLAQVRTEYMWPSTRDVDYSREVRIWDTVGEDQTLKGEYKVITGRV